MATFIMFGKYSSDGFKGISAQRTKKVNELVKKHEGEIKAMYALLGVHDLILIMEFPDNEQAMKASVALQKLTGISFITSLAMPVEEFDKLVS
ncbi:MAG: GYD domain-containing protein [Deltaproteobacteria bacterium]|nr:GYD domain-containing protein [Deltaproteobacteria bacterium]